MDGSGTWTNSVAAAIDGKVRTRLRVKTATRALMDDSLTAGGEVPAFLIRYTQMRANAQQVLANSAPNSLITVTDDKKIY